MENEELQKMVEETLSLSRENNAMLIKIRRTQKMAQITRIIHWVIVIGVSIGAFYYLQPYLEKLLSFYSQVSGFKGAASTFFK